jgi:hypothetical protein
MTTNLSGSLSEFSLAEVLSLLGMGGRTARMQVTCADAVGTVHLVDGRISSATADSARAGLLRGVVAALPVPADDLAQALLAEAPVRSLVDSGVVDREGAQQVASEHCTEAVGEMLDWTSGEFAVWVGSQDPADIGVRLDVHELVAAARERAQEWHDLRAALPEPDSVLALVPDVAQAPVVDREDWAVLARIDGRRTLAEVLAAQGASPLAAGNRLVQLLGRGLVAVRVGGGDAEQQRTNQMLDAFDAGGPVDEVVVDEVVEVVASAEPEFVPEVHDLFVTEPEAVEEWQVAVADSWSDSELAPVVSVSAESSAEPSPDPAPVPAEEYAASSEWAGMVAPEFLSGTEPQHSESFAAEVEPVPFDLDPTALELEPTAYEIEPTTFELEPTTYELEPTAYDLQATTLEADPTSYELESATVEVEPTTYRLQPGEVAAEPVAYEADLQYDVESEVQEGAPVTFDLEPLADPVGETFAWSPWAQEMGLGEAPVVAAAPESLVGGGFADMVENAGGHGHTDAFPVPLAPVGEVSQVHAAAEYAPPKYAPVDEVSQFMPQPRDPGDGVGEPMAYSAVLGAHAAYPESPEAQAEEGLSAEGPEAHVESASDPLAGGLLAHLMSSVRGL